MKILCVIDSLCLGGAQRQLVELAVGFKGRGHQVSFLTYHDIPFYAGRLEENQIPVVCIPGRNYLHRLLSMRRFVRSHSFDGVLSFLEAASFICEISGFPGRKWRLVVGERSANPGILSSLKLRMYRLFHLFADAVVANSGENIRIIRKANPFLHPGKCRVIYNLVDVDAYKVPASFTFRKTGKLRVVVAARMEGLKNLSGLIDALQELDQEARNQLQIEWYGGADEKMEELVERAGLKEQIFLYPPIQDIKSIIASCDAVGLFSTHEGLPNAVCEGMACGKPVLCSAISDLPQLLAHEPELLFDPNQSASIAKALKTLIGMDPEKMEQSGQKNRELARLHFNPEIVIGQYLVLLGKEDKV